MKHIVIIVVSFAVSAALFYFQVTDALSTAEEELPILNDPSLIVEVVYSGLDRPTDMAFLGSDDILVLEKNTGTVQRIVNGQLLSEPLLDVNVANKVERCMCGIVISKQIPDHTYVFLYYTETEKADGEDVTLQKEPLGNRLYRYELTNNSSKLVNPKLLLDLPAVPGSIHNGGKVAIGHDNNIYVAVGDIMGGPLVSRERWQTTAQNYVDGIEPDGRSGILRITQDGNQVPNGGVIGYELPLNMYYAYGIRNSFGIDFDPLSGNLWDTENGPNYGDEINLVEPGFNSGWNVVQGIWEREGDNVGDIALRPEDTLVDFDGKGNYSSPEFMWYYPVGITSLKFLHSDKLGKQYENDIFAGDYNSGNIYHFELNQDRTELLLSGSLEDKVADTQEEYESVLFGEGFSKGITDLEVGNDGYLYVLAYGGTIYRIIPNH